MKIYRFFFLLLVVLLWVNLNVRKIDIDKSDILLLVWRIKFIGILSLRRKWLIFSGSKIFPLCHNFFSLKLASTEAPSQEFCEINFQFQVLTTNPINYVFEISFPTQLNHNFFLLLILYIFRRIGRFRKWRNRKMTFG